MRQIAKRIFFTSDAAKYLIGRFFLCACILLPLSISQAAVLSEGDAKAYEKAFEAAKKGQWKSALKAVKSPKDRQPAKALRWLYYKSSKNQATFSEITGFIQANPTWPHLGSLREQAEQKIVDSTPKAEILNWFSTNEPRTARGLIRYAEVLKNIGKVDEAKALIRAHWVTMDMNSQNEKVLRKRFKSWITKEDNEIRLERLIWEGHIYAGLRQAKRVDKNLRYLAEARIALRRKKGGVDNAIARVPQNMRSHPGLVYERMRWRARKGRDAGAIELLQLGVDETAYPELWWKERGRLARRALKDENVTLAYELASNHQAESGFPFADAEWLAGWIALRYLDQPKIAFKHFVSMHERVSYPVSLARGGYWAGRAAEAMGNLPMAHAWYKKAAIHTTSYYGQLAADHVNIGERPLIPLEYKPTAAEKTDFENRELVKLIPKLAQAKADDLIWQIIRAQIKSAERESDFVLLAQLSHRIDKREHAVYAARQAIKAGYILTETGYPIMVMPKKAPLDEVLAMSIIRQESAFQLDAKSRVGARGLMQLMPATAKSTAKKAKLKYNKAKLVQDGKYNIHLGSHYLNGLINRFEGSLPMAFAGYNAGPHRSSRWAKAHGDPRQSLEQAIDWIELIPFDETQNYVQRVLENMVVYQHKLKGQHLPLTQSAMNTKTAIN